MISDQRLQRMCGCMPGHPCQMHSGHKPQPDNTGRASVAAENPAEALAEIRELAKKCFVAIDTHYLDPDPSNRSGHSGEIEGGPQLTLRANWHPERLARLAVLLGLRPEGYTGEGV